MPAECFLPHGFSFIVCDPEGAVLAASYIMDLPEKEGAVYIKLRYGTWPWRGFSPWCLHVP